MNWLHIQYYVNHSQGQKTVELPKKKMKKIIKLLKKVTKQCI